MTVVTGFLGAGKTTLIRAALAHPSAARTAVIVNEFADAGIDDVLLRTAALDVTLIGNGCICCAARSDLNRALRALYADRERGAVPPFDRVVVETSGVSEPAPVLQSFAADRTVTGSYALEGLVTVVDSVLAARTQSQASIWSEQVALADRIILTKADLVLPAGGAEVRALVGALNPQAEIADAADVRDVPGFLFGAPGRSRSGFACTPQAATPGVAPYDSFVLTFDAAFDWATFMRIMDALSAARSEDLLRVKGLVNVRGCDGPVVVHHVQHLAAPPEELAAWPPAGDSADRRTRLVFITRGLSRQKVAALFAAHLDLQPGEAAGSDRGPVMRAG
ncbi:GTP-binding protein [Xanthobacter sp. KR7-65]|uniref:CobW family GTP-binding protein n=1 Tax=Xanthobacter sp. KR7-65 TaxID=3156612 RepID=UPI0032B46704